MTFVTVSKVDFHFTLRLVFISLLLTYIPRSFMVVSYKLVFSGLRCL